MKIFLQITRRVLSRCCILYTVMSLLLFLIGSAVPSFGNMIEVGNLLTIFLFALLLACANLILGVRRFPIYLRVLLHYLASAATYYGVFILIGQRSSGSGILANMLFFTLLYALVIGVYLFMYHSLRVGEEKPDTNYKKIYK